MKTHGIPLAHVAHAIALADRPGAGGQPIRRSQLRSGAASGVGRRSLACEHFAPVREGSVATGVVGGSSSSQPPPRRERYNMHSSTQPPFVEDADGASAPPPEEPTGGVSRRSFLATGVAVGAGAALGPLGIGATAFADRGGFGLTEGDAAILRFLAAAEILETDLWQQYNELGGIQDSEVPGGSGSAPYVAALEELDRTCRSTSTTTPRMSSLTSRSSTPTSNRGARTPSTWITSANLPSSKAPGAQQIGRLTNLMELTVDTSWWTRYRSRTKNPDFGDTFPQAVPGAGRRQVPGDPAKRSRPRRRKSTSRRSRTRRDSISGRSSRAARASTPRLPSGSAIQRYCASC